MAAVAGARLCLLAAGLLAGLLLLAGVCQLVCGLFLLLKAPRPAVNGAAIAAGVWVSQKHHHRWSLGESETAPPMESR